MKPRIAAWCLFALPGAFACTGGDDATSNDANESGGAAGSSAGVATGGTGAATTTGGAGNAGSAGMSGEAGSGTAGRSGAGAGGRGNGGSSMGGAGAPGGAAGTGGASCTDVDTQTDPENCGACGRVCKNTEPVILSPICDEGECCIAGECQPYIATECVQEGSPYDTCADLCENISEQCVEGGCSGATWYSWPTSNSLCEGFSGTLGRSVRPCDDVIEWSADVGKVRCCCTDTQP